MNEAADFAAVFVALWVGHTVGDHWVQTHHQALTKGKRSRAGIVANTRHVTTLTVTKLVILAPVVFLLGVHLNPWWAATGILIDAASHWWADRRYTLKGMAGKLKKDDFYALGSDTVHTSGLHGTHNGTGAYALDQSFHAFFLFVAALVMVVG